ncbi:MAG: hypothetical protein HY000_35150 [Planctomycetes bacterium]|nr:hypothetical protein [Planctomycetota bacterium]
MDIQQRLKQVADGYRAQGYNVVVRPGRDDLPDFAKDFRVEFLARRNDGCILASAKKSQSDLEADQELPRYAEVVGKQPGWRFDIFVLEPESHPLPEKGEAREPSEEDIHRAIADVEEMVRVGFVQQALIAAWAVMESAMRRRLQADGQDSAWRSSPRSMLNELYSDGVLQRSVFRDLEGLLQARSAIVHGFAPPVIDSSSVGLLVDTARMLLEESLAGKKIT